MGIKVQSDNNYGTDYDESLRRVINELVSNLNNIEKLEYQLNNFEKIDYGDNNKIMNIICEAYLKNLNKAQMIL